MSKDRRIVISIVLLALFCSALPIITSVVMGSGGLNGTRWDQVPQQFDQPAIFASMPLAKFMNGALLIPIIGLALSLYYRPRNRQKFQWAAVSFVLFLVETILFAVLSSALEINYHQQGASAEQMAAGFAAVNYVSTSINLLAWSILLFAIFSPKFNSNHENPDTK